MRTSESTIQKNTLMDRHPALFFILPSVLFLSLVQVYPVIYAFYLSFMKTRGRTMTFVGLQNYINLLLDSDFWESLSLTLIFTAGFLILTMGLGLLFALLLNSKIKHSKLYILLIFTPWVLSPVVAGTMWRWLFQPQYGLVQDLLNPLFHTTLISNDIGAMAIVILALVWRNLPLTTLLYLGGLQTIPLEIYESASIDGAGVIKKFSSITFPLIKSTLLINLLMNTIKGINVISIVLSITRGGPGRATEIMGVYLYRLAWQYGDFGSGASMGIIMFLITAGISLFYFKSIRTEDEL